MENVIVYGTGKYGKIFEEKCGMRYNILFYVDGNKKKQGEKFFDKEIKSPDVLKDHLTVQIIIAVHNYTDICFRLIEIGCKAVYKFHPASGVMKINVDKMKKYKDSVPVYWKDSHEVLRFDEPYACTSQICNQNFFDIPFFQYWAEKFMPNLFDHLRMNTSIYPSDEAYKQPVLYHRKLWEWVYISQALYERGMLNPGKKGVAFGVGEECTPDLYASFGCRILATDLGLDDAIAQGWIESGQNAGGNVSKLNKYGFCSVEEFYDRVSYRDVDMNNIQDDIRGFDFCWSACALEHLGGLQKGLDFIRNSLETIVSGGIAIHTTEFNLSHDAEAFETEGLSIYRKCEIESFVDQLQSEGHYVYPVDWHMGEGVVDKFIDLPPHGKKDMHLKLCVEEYPCTSFGIIIKKK